MGPPGPGPAGPSEHWEEGPAREKEGVGPPGPGMVGPSGHWEEGAARGEGGGGAPQGQGWWAPVGTGRPCPRVPMAVCQVARKEHGGLRAPNLAKDKTATGFQDRTIRDPRSLMCGI